MMQREEIKNDGDRSFGLCESTKCLYRRPIRIKKTVSNTHPQYLQSLSMLLVLYIIRYILADTGLLRRRHVCST
jgi:hypothetical protein